MSVGVTVAGEEPAPGELVGVEAGGRRIVVCNVEGRLYALEDRCPHAAVPLRGGRLDGCLLECPVHGGRLDVRDGRPERAPIRRPARTFPVRAVAGGLEIQLD